MNQVSWKAVTEKKLSSLTSDLTEEPTKYTAWETQFILSVERQWEKKGELSEKQRQKIDSIFNEHINEMLRESIDDEDAELDPLDAWPLSGSDSDSGSGTK